MTANLKEDFETEQAKKMFESMSAVFDVKMREDD